MWYILDKNLNTIGALNTGASLDLRIESDSVVTRLEQSFKSIEFVADAKHETAKLLTEENYIVVPNENGINHSLFKISETEFSNDGLEATIRVFGESNHVHDLSGTVVRPTSFISQTLAEILGIITAGTGWTVGDVDYQQTYTQEITDYPTVLQTIFDFTDTLTDCSVNFIVEMRSGKLVSKKVEVIKLGSDRGAVFSFDRNLNGLTRKVNIEEIYSAILPIGKGEGDNYLTIQQATTNTTPPSGYEFIGSDTLGHIESKEKWSPNGYRTFVYQDSDAENWLDLYNRALKKLDEIRQPKIEYNCDIETLNALGYRLEDFDKGDTVTIQDHEFEIYLQARVSEKTISSTDPDNGSITLSNFKKLDLKQSLALQTLQQKILLKEKDWTDAAALAEQAKQTADKALDKAESGVEQIKIGYQPANPVIDQLWMDTSSTPNQIYRWDGSFWVATTFANADQVIVSEVEPVNPKHNTLWMSTSVEPNQLLRFDDPNMDGSGIWVATYDDKETIIQAVVQSQTIQSMFDNKASKEELDIYATTDSINEQFETVQSRQDLLSQSVDNRLSPLESQVGEIDTKVEAMKGELAIKFSSNASGINLLRNSIGWANGYSFQEVGGSLTKTRTIDFWGYGTNAATGSSIATEAQFGYIDSFEVEPYGSAWTSKGGSYVGKTFQQVTGLTIGTTYTLGALFKRSSTVSADQCLIRVYYYNSSTSTYTQVGTTFGLNSASGKVDDWRYASISFTAPSSNIIIQIEVLSTVTQTVSITSVMLNEGDLPYGWTPHSEEIYSTGVSFNINGIKVQSGSNYTQMTSNEFSGYVLEGVNQTPRRIFSLNGTTTEVANLEAEDSIRMGTVKIVKHTNGWSFMRNG